MPAESLELSQLVGVCLLGALSPGPSLLVILGLMARYGARVAILAAWAHAFGVGIWALITLSGWSAISNYAPWATATISTAGALYLIYLAWTFMRREAQLFTESSGLEETEHAPEAPLATSRITLTETIKRASPGLMIALSNPKLMIFFTAIYTQVLPQRPSETERFVACITPLLIDGAWYSAVALGASRWGLLSYLSRHERAVRYLTAALFLMIAAQTAREILSAPT